MQRPYIKAEVNSVDTYHAAEPRGKYLALLTDHQVKMPEGRERQIGYI